MKRLNNKLNEIQNNLDIKISDKTRYSLNSFINTIDCKQNKAKDFNTLVSKIENSYIEKNIKSEEFYVRNILQAYNTKTKSHLFDFSDNDYSKNYRRRINESIFNQLANTSGKREIVNLLNNLETFQHKGNTDFIEQLDFKSNSKKFAKVKYLDYKNSHKTAVILTFTLDGEFRKYEKINDGKLGEFEGLKESNSNANLEDLVDKSYVELNKRFRDFYSYFKTLNRRSKDKDKLDFILVAECHLSLTLHLHILFFCNDTQLVNLNRSWEHYLTSLTNKQKKGQDKTVIDKDKSSAYTYLSKYLIKEYGKDENNTGFYMKFKRYFSKYNLFRCSNFYHTTQARIDKMYSYLSKNFPDILRLITSQSKVPLYEILEQFEIEGIFEFKMEKVLSVSIDRKMLKQRFLANENNLNLFELKDDLIDNIDLYTKSIYLTRISNVKFIYNENKFFSILEKFKIDTSEIELLDDYIEDFYFYGIYELRSMSLNKSLAIVNT